MTVALAALPLAAVGWFLIDVNRGALATAAEDQLTTVVADLAIAGDRALDRGEAALGAVASALTDESRPADQRIDLAAALVRGEATLGAVGVYDRTGAKIDALGDPRHFALLPEALPAPLVDGARTGLPAVGPAVASADGPRVLMVVRAADRPEAGFVAAPLSLAPLQDQVEATATRVFGGDLDSVLVVDETDRVIAHPDPERAHALARAADDSVAGVLGRAGAAGPAARVRFAAFRSYRRHGVAVFGAGQSLAEVPWLVIAERPHAEVYASIPRMRRVVIGGIALAMLAAIGAAIAWSGRLAAPVRRLVGFADDLAHRRFDRRVAIATGDELEDLATAMSGAAAELEASEATIARERKIRGELGRYLPGQLVDQVVRQEQAVQLGGERRTITVLFADVASFTSLVEKVPPETVVTILNQLFTILTEVVFRHGGTVDKFIGDCVMAFWGAPAEQPDHAARAVAAAEDMLRWLELGNEAWRVKHGVTIHLAIGVNSGDAVVGNFGSESRMEYTCIGDTVNVASRLEALARPQQILVSRATRDRAPGPAYVPLGTHQAPGRAEPLEIFEVAT